MPNIVHRLQITDANQYDLKIGISNPMYKRIVHLCSASKGTRDFVYLMFITYAGEITYYINEVISGQPEMIEDDQLFEEVARFFNDYTKKIKGSDI